MIHKSFNNIRYENKKSYFDSYPADGGELGEQFDGADESECIDEKMRVDGKGKCRCDLRQGPENEETGKRGDYGHIFEKG